MNDLLVIPKCEYDGSQMKYVVPRRYEKGFDGAMYKCPQCGRSILYPSKELREFLKGSEENKNVK